MSINTSPLVPIPTIDDPLTGPYWRGAAEGKLVIQRCATCGTYRWYPRPACNACWSFDTEWVAAQGRGHIYSWVRVHHPFTPAFRDFVPYDIVVVKLLEGVRAFGALEKIAGEPVIGAEVEARFAALTDELVMPYFALTGQ